jgi:hypothetical protein
MINQHEIQAKSSLPGAPPETLPDSAPSSPSAMLSHFGLLAKVNNELLNSPPPALMLKCPSLTILRLASAVE